MRSHPAFGGLLAALVLGFVSTLALAAPARHWSVVELTADSPGGGTARAVNNRGDVVGQTFTGSGFHVVSHAYVWRNGVREDIAAGLGESSIAWAINGKGTIAGSVDGTAYMWKDGRPIPLQAAGDALGINDRDEVVGHFWTGGVVGSGRELPFLFRDGTVYPLPTLGGRVSSEALAINDRGMAIGFSLIANTSDTHGVLWEDGAVRDLATLGGRNSFAERINEAGEIVGRAQDADGNFDLVRWRAGGGPPEVLFPRSQPGGINNRGAIVGNHQDTGMPFLYEDGQTTSLLDLPAMKAGGWQAFSPMGINDRGWIVGIAWKPGVAFVGTALLLVPG